jgi:DNA-binding transcriptional ArsR family regulator
MPDAPTPDRSQIDVRDPKAMRALANPLRLRLLGFLRRSGPHSVGELSELADAAPGSVSYHLSTLEKFGFVEEAPEFARDGREHWWRAAHSMTHYEPSEMLADPESAAAGRVMRQTFMQGYLTEQLDYLDAEPALPIEWVKAATAGDILAYLTADELREFSDEVNALAEKWNIQRDPERHGVAPIRFIYSSFRQP